MFRNLKAEEIECRPQSISAKGCTLLLYKDARVDANILDEEVGPMNWQRKHTRENANCIVSIWDEKKQMWIEKEDTGTESNTEKAKGLASDSFKRACFAWGIGRELYTSPFIWVKAGDVTLKDGKNGNKTTYDKFIVKSIKVENGVITELQIVNKNLNKVVFAMGKEKIHKPVEINSELTQKQVVVMEEMFRVKKLDVNKMLNGKTIDSLTIAEYEKVMDKLKEHE